MNQSSRLLQLEPIEDRALPSASFLSFQPTFHSHERVSSFNGGESSARTYTFHPVITDARGHSFVLENVIVRFQPGRQPQIITLSNSWFSQPITPTPPVAQQPSVSQNSDTQETFQSESQVRSSATQARSTIRAKSTDDFNGVEQQPVSIEVAVEATTAAKVEAAANATAERVQPVQNPVFLAGGANAVETRASYPLIEGLDADVDSAANGVVAPPVQSVEPPVAPVPEQKEPGDIEQLAAAAVLPIAGLLPFDVVALGDSTQNFLDSVSDLTPEWPSSMPQFEDYMWTAAAVLLTGGAIMATRNRNREIPRGPVGLDSAFAEWESKNARRFG
jgi:hypothetical protein